jgi:nicotinamidase-related amidase
MKKISSVFKQVSSRGKWLRRNGHPAALAPAALILLLLVPAFIIAETPSKIDAATALIVIDVQEFYFPGGALPLENPESAALNCKKLLTKFRDENHKIIHVGHKVRQGRSFHPDVEPLEGEKIVMKSEASAFKGTELAEYLRQHEVKRLVICGMQTHMCVEAAVRAASDLGFECILVHDACATRSLKFEDSVTDAASVHRSTLNTLAGTYATVVDTDSFLKDY